jgi:hypothetical protein
MTTPYNSNYDMTIPFSDGCAQIALAANAAQSYTVPGTANINYSVRFTYTYNSNVFVCLNTTPTVPAGGSVGTQQYNEFRPGSDSTQRYVKGGDVIYFITPDTTAYLGIRLMSVVA